MLWLYVYLARATTVVLVNQWCFELTMKESACNGIEVHMEGSIIYIEIGMISDVCSAREVRCELPGFFFFGE